MIFNTIVAYFFGATVYFIECEFQGTISRPAISATCRRYNCETWLVLAEIGNSECSILNAYSSFAPHAQ